MKFELSEKKIDRFNQWTSKHSYSYTGAIGGRYTFEFTPTGLALIIRVIDNATKEILDLTDWESV